MKIVFNMIFFVSILFGLTDEQLERIRTKTDDVLLAPNFTLKSLESRSFCCQLFFGFDISRA